MSYKLMLKEIRKNKGLSQEDMADKLNMSLSTYRTWEQGVSRISLENAFKICNILGCSPNDLCGWGSEKTLTESEQQVLETLNSLKRKGAI